MHLSFFNVMATKTKLTPLTLNCPGGAVPISEEQFREFVAPEFEDQHHDVEVRGPWQQPVKLQALAVSYTWSGNFAETITLYGKRSLCSLKESGYQLEGKVSINNVKLRGFTSGQLFELPDGRLIDVAVIVVCSN